MRHFFGKKSRSVLALIIMISFALHVVAILIFGTIKFVSSVLREPEVFDAAPVEVPPQEEPEYQVNLEERNESAPPPKPQSIVVNNPSELEIPSLEIDVDVNTSAVYGRSSGSFGKGLEGMRVGDLELTQFGYSGRAAGTLEGTLIDLKRDEDGDPTNLNSLNQRIEAIRNFTDSSWSISRLTNKYYSAEKKLYASYWIIPMGPADKAPQSFGVGGEIEPSGLVAIYEGTYKPTEDMFIRFCGAADDAIIVRFNSRIVFDGSRNNGYSDFDLNNHRRGPPIAGMNTQTTYGDWISLRAGRTYDLNVLLAEVPGGVFGCMLFYQIRGDDKLRVFSTKPFTDNEKKQLRKIHADVAKGLE